MINKIEEFEILVEQHKSDEIAVKEKIALEIKQLMKDKLHVQIIPEFIMLSVAQTQNTPLLYAVTSFNGSVDLKYVDGSGRKGSVSVDHVENVNDLLRDYKVLFTIIEKGLV